MHAVPHVVIRNTTFPRTLDEELITFFEGSWEAYMADRSGLLPSMGFRFGLRHRLSRIPGLSDRGSDLTSCGRPASLAEQDLVHRLLAYAAKLLTEAGVSVIVDATAGRRAWREAARDLIPCFAEIQLLCPTEICLERERAVRWGLTFETSRPQAATPAPDIVLDYEESPRPDLAIRTDVYDVQAATERVLFVIQRLAGSPSREAARAERGRRA